MSTNIQETKERYKAFFSDPKFRRSFFMGFALLFLSILVNYFAALYAFERASNSVSDIVLSNIPVFDVDWIFVWGPLIFWIIMAFFILPYPNRVPFTLKSIAIFVLIRCVFVTLTHIGPFPDQVPIDLYGAEWIQRHFDIKPYFLFVFSSGADLFFSAHTGIPFLMALTFWKRKKIRVFCLVSSGFFGAVVLMGHLHYSIDVLSAFFITYTIYHISSYMYSEDKRSFLGYSQVLDAKNEQVT